MYTVYWMVMIILSLYSVDAPVSKSGPSYSGGPRIQRQEQVIHLSPKKSSQVGGSSLLLQSTAVQSCIQMASDWIIND